MTIFRKLLLSLIFFIAPLYSQASEKDLPPELIQAAQVIRVTYGDEVSYQAKGKFLLKFGRTNIGDTTPTTVMTLATGEVHETYVNTNVIDKYSSDSASDATEIITVEGHTCSGSGHDLKLTFVIQNITMDALVESPLTTPLCRVTRAFNNNGTELVGNVYFYQDDTVVLGVPQTGSKVHLIIPAGKQQSAKASTSVSDNDYLICTEVYGSIIEKAASFADFELQLRLPGGVFREQLQFAANSQGGTSDFRQLNPPLIVPRNSDVRLVGTADNAATQLSGGFNCYLALVQ